jgi:hypothetical protein
MLSIAASVAALLSVFVASHALGDDSALNAKLECARIAAPGRIVCELRASATTFAGSGRLVWLDALVVRAPDFARPLRSRVVAQVTPAGSSNQPGTAAAKLALVASSAGTGTLELSVRAVICRDGTNGEWCGPVVVRVASPVAVGASAP